ncbi:stealth family protein [Acinetobacter faecalis]|uniref:stealth family protein n=1 Tax=Acinetobacter faecalis TaxID=2665161 RepID=UPI002A909B66|nr:stealth family protein [Acinetobacter faecalis]MDY6462451.1 stealth family protein [Acinetobacter faecalis]
MNKKFQKLIKNPGIFFRDYFMKKYPIINTEQKFTEDDELAVNIVKKRMHEIENKIPDFLNFDVDIVYTWVNDQDPNWIKKRKSYSLNEQCLNDSTDIARFENHNELYYSILSVKKFLPWVRNIYIVTDNQKPDWLEDGSNIFIVDHKDIIDKQYLPTFNSHVIEAHLHKINGLSEHFIYFNDDVLVAKPLSKEHFFRKNGVASIFSSKKSLKAMYERGVITATLLASRNSNEILKKQFGIKLDLPLVHTYVPLKKSIFKKYWENNFDVIQGFLPNKYRAKNDVNMATFLVPWSMYLEGKSIITSEICYYFNIRSPHALQQYKKLLRMKNMQQWPHSICVNDFKVNEDSSQNFSQNLEKFLNDYYL